MMYHGHSRYSCVGLVTFQYRLKNSNPENLLQANDSIKFTTIITMEIFGGNVSLPKREIINRFIAQVKNPNNLIKRFVESSRNIDKLGEEDIEIIPESIEVPEDRIVITAMSDSKLS